MQIPKRLFVSGYRNFELGIFQDNDKKIKIIKAILRNKLIEYLEQGLEWVIIGGNLGIEFWSFETVLELKEEYPSLKVSVIFPFETFGEQWKENNQLKLLEMKEMADYTDATSHHPYQNPGQFKSHTQFLLSHTDGALLVYDEAYPGKTGYFLTSVKKWQEQAPYFLELLTMDDLNNYMENL